MRRKPRENESYLTSAQYQILTLFIRHPELDFSAIEDGHFFTSSKMRTMFNQVKTIRSRGEAVNETTLLRECNQLDSTIDIQIIKMAIGQDVEPSNLEGAIKSLIKGSTKHRVKKHLNPIMEHLESLDDLSVNSVSDALYKATDELRNNGKKVVAKTFEQSLDDYHAELKIREKGIYYPFNDPFLDKTLTKKAAPGQVVLIAGATGTGKSMYALNLVNKMIDNNTPTMYFSLEMDTISTFDRLLAMRNGVTVDSWYDTKEYQNWYKILDAERARVGGKPFQFIDNPGLSLDNIVTLIRQFKLKYETDYICVYIDLITQVKDFISAGAKSPLATVIEMAVNKLNAIAKTENVCFVAVAQMNRDADSVKLVNKDDVYKLRPSLNNVKNSNALAERSRTVLGVFRPLYYLKRAFPNSPDMNLDLEDDILQVQVLKQSQGNVGNVGCYQFNGATAETIFVENLGDTP